MNPISAVRRWVLAPTALVLLASSLVHVPPAAAGALPCVGDCGTDGAVSVADLSLAIEVALLRRSPDDCTPATRGDGSVTVDDVVRGVDERLSNCQYVTPTPTPTPPRPDLVPQSVVLVATPAAGCVASLSEIDSSLVACVRNQGEGPAPAFEAALDGQRLSFPALPAGHLACASLHSLGSPGGILLDVDPDDTVVESDESNNQETFHVPVLTPPLTCTATPTDTPLPPGTPSNTPTPSNTAAPSHTQTPSHIPTATRSFTPSPSPTPSPTPGLPDLAPNRVEVVAPTPVGGCVENLNDVELSLLVCVVNDGSGPSGPFRSSLTVASSLFVDFQGIPAMTEACAPGPFIDGQLIFTVDTDHQVTESDEANNERQFSVPRPTPPPLCPTKTPTGR